MSMSAMVVAWVVMVVCPRPLGQPNGPRNYHSEQQRQGQADSIVRMEFHFRQQIA